MKQICVRHTARETHADILISMDRMKREGWHIDCMTSHDGWLYIVYSRKGTNHERNV